MLRDETGKAFWLGGRLAGGEWEDGFLSNKKGCWFYPAAPIKPPSMESSQRLLAALHIGSNIREPAMAQSRLRGEKIGGKPQMLFTTLYNWAFYMADAGLSRGKSGKRYVFLQ